MVLKKYIQVLTSCCFVGLTVAVVCSYNKKVKC